MNTNVGGENCDTLPSCEWNPSDYEIINPENRYDGQSKPRKKEPPCISNDGSSNLCVSANSDEVTCEQYSGSRSQPLGCKWKCQVPTARTNYIIKKRTGLDAGMTIPVDDVNYYGLDEIIVECDSNATQQDVRQSPSATCGTDNNNFTFTGCIEKLYCHGDPLPGGRVVDRLEYKDSAGAVILQPVNGDFPCPEPYSLKTEVQDTPREWINGTKQERIDQCCERVGLCSGNDGGTGDITCDTGTQHKKVNGDFIRGATKEICCEVAGAPTLKITFSDLANYNGLVGRPGTNIRNTFELNFKNDIHQILTQGSDSINAAITVDDIEINKIEKGSVIITFTIKPDVNNQIVTRDELNRLLPMGVSLTTLGIRSMVAPEFTVFDPSEGILFELFGYGIDITKLIIMISSVFCLLILLMVLLK